MNPSRRSPPFWRHDAYTLNRLQRYVVGIAKQLGEANQGKGQPKNKVVDLGAGSSPYRDVFEDLEFDYIDCDLEGNTAIVIRPGEQVPLESESAMVVVSFQVLEHVWDLDWYLGEARRLLKSNGTLLLSTHGTWLYHPHPTDFRRWTRDGLVAELSTRGFEVKSIIGLVGPLAWTTQFRALGLHHFLSAVPLIGPVLSAVVCSGMHVRMILEEWLTPDVWRITNAAVYVVTAQRKNQET